MVYHRLLFRNLEAKACLVYFHGPLFLQGGLALKPSKSKGRQKCPVLHPTLRKVIWGHDCTAGSPLTLFTPHRLWWSHWSVAPHQG